MAKRAANGDLAATAVMAVTPARKELRRGVTAATQVFVIARGKKSEQARYCLEAACESFLASFCTLMQ